MDSPTNFTIREDATEEVEVMEAEREKSEVG